MITVLQRRAAIAEAEKMQSLGTEKLVLLNGSKCLRGKSLLGMRARVTSQNVLQKIQRT